MGRRPAPDAGPDGRVRLTSFRGTAWCHVPADEPVELEKLAGADGSNRWNRDGQPTLYLALDPAVAVAELARHQDAGVAHTGTRRRLLRLDVEASGLADVRDPGVRTALGGPAAVADLLDREVARGVADAARATDGCRGLLVPSAAFLDAPERGNVVLFLDAWPGGVAETVQGCSAAGAVTLDAS